MWVTSRSWLVSTKVDWQDTFPSDGKMKRVYKYQFKTDRQYRLALRAERVKNRAWIKTMEHKVVGF